jgi:hypothetical protein
LLSLKLGHTIQLTNHGGMLRGGESFLLWIESLNERLGEAFGLFRVRGNIPVGSTSYRVGVSRRYTIKLTVTKFGMGN